MEKLEETLVPNTWWVFEKFTASDVIPGPVMVAEAIANPALLRYIYLSGSGVGPERFGPTGGDAFLTHPTVSSH